MSLMAPSEARRRMLGAASVIGDLEMVALEAAAGRTLGSDLKALRTQPPFAASAMDGFAVRAADLAGLAPLRVIGEAAAGHPFSDRIGPGEAVRIFTGTAIPPGADTVLMQENVSWQAAGTILPLQAEPTGRFVREAGLDFRTGEVLLTAGTRIDARRLGLSASMGHAALPVRRRPKVTILSTGDELVLPGRPEKPGQIVTSNAYAIAALAGEAGGVALDLGIVPDTAAATSAAIAKACEGADLVITCGGASVGDHDFVRAALLANGFAIDFWKVAIRPGKPLMFGRRGQTLCLGLPGNPVSSLVCGLIFMQPLIRALLGQRDADRDAREPATLGQDLPANDQREDYMRASLARDAAGRLVATPYPRQDSSMQRLMAEADALLIRTANAPAALKGDACEIIRLGA